MKILIYIANKFIRNNYLFQWCLLGIGLVLLGGAVFNNLYKSYREIEKGEHSRIITQSKVINDILGSQLESTDKILSVLRDELSNLPIHLWKSAVSNRRVDILVHAIAGIRTILVTDANGIVRISNRENLVGIDVNKRDYFAFAQENPDRNKLYVSQPSMTVLGVWGLNLTRVITGAKGEFSGIIVATLDPYFFKTLLGSVNYAPDMWSAIAHWDGIQFLMEPGEESQTGKFLAHPGTFFTRHKESGRNLNVLKGHVYASGDQRIMALRTIKPATIPMDKPLIVAVGRNLDSITAGWRSDFSTETSRFLIVVLVSMIILFVFQRRHRAYQRNEKLAEIAIKESAHRLKLATEAAGVGIWEYQLASGNLVWDPSMYAIFSVKPDEFKLYFGSWIDLMVPEDSERVKNEIDESVRGGNPLETEFRIKQGGVDIKTIRTKGKLSYDEAGRPERVVGTCEDVTERRKIQSRLLKLTHGIENSASAVMITDVNGIIEYVNKKFTQVTGFQSDEAIGKNPRILKSESTPREVFENLWNTILEGKEWRGELLNRRKTGEVYWSITSISPLRDDKGTITHFIANVEDISERKNAEATIEHLAYYDPLTNLPNRRMMNDRLDMAIKRSRRQGDSMALIYLDLDNFKHINDSLGHPAGDKLLQEMASRYVAILREDDIICRLGGDEFAVILNDLEDNNDAGLVAQKLHEATLVPVLLDGTEVVVTASQGIAVFPKDAEDVKTLEKHADISLYHAKGEGKQNYCFFSDELNQASSDRMMIVQGLRYALDRNELLLYYQPKIDLQSGKMIGVEALIRWNSEKFGMVSPIRFIPLAEETRMIIPIGEWVLRTSCLQQVAWKSQGIDIPVAVNLSSVQFKSQDIAGTIGAILRETGIETDRLELELTESILVDKPDKAAMVLHELRALGCGIAIDDFGTGYSSLSYLKKFPLTVLKIDQSFVRDLINNSGDRAIAQSVVHLAVNLDLVTVAEGVEHAGQEDILKRIGCKYAQGYLYSRPVLPGEIQLLAGRMGVLDH